MTSLLTVLCRKVRVQDAANDEGGEGEAVANLSVFQHDTFCPMRPPQATAATAYLFEQWTCTAEGWRRHVLARKMVNHTLLKYTPPGG